MVTETKRDPARPRTKKLYCMQIFVYIYLNVFFPAIEMNYKQLLPLLCQHELGISHVPLMEEHMMVMFDG